MISRVDPSARYEEPRAAYTALKRPLSVPPGRLVNPRLEQDLPTDSIKGLGRRKIPTSTQRPTRTTNTAIVYSRVAATRSVHRTQLSTGDVMFVAKSDAVFGAGVDRFSRCASLRDVNELLKLERNRLSDVDVEMAAKYETSRSTLLECASRIATHNMNDVGLMQDPAVKSRQVVPGDYDKSMTQDKKDVSRLSKALAIANTAVYAKASIEAKPEYDWLSIPAIQEWRLDGVLYGKETDAELNAVVPNCSVDDSLLNVCVGGPCPVRNQKLAKVPQFFDVSVAAGDLLYLCLVAVPRNDDTWEFFILPLASSQFERGAEVQGLQNVAASWQLGRVVDNNLVNGQHARLLVNVEIELMTRSTFFRRLCANSGNELEAWLQPIKRPPAAPPLPPRDWLQPIKRPSPPRSAPPAAPPLPPLPPRDLFTLANPEDVPEPPPLPPLPGRDLFILPNREGVPDIPDPAMYPRRAQGAQVLLLGGHLTAKLEKTPDEDRLFILGREAMNVNFNMAPRSGTSAVASFTWNYMRTANIHFPQRTNGEIGRACLTYTHRTLESMPLLYQREYASHALYMTNTGFYNALDTYLSTAGPSIKDYNDNCYLFSLMTDNGLTHALCIALRNALFKENFKPSSRRTNETASKVEFTLLSFEPPPMTDGAFDLTGVLDMEPFWQQARGATVSEKSRRISFSLNLLFDFSVNEEWLRGFDYTFTRRPDPPNVLEFSRAARARYITDNILTANAVSTEVQSANYLTFLCCFAILNVSAISPSMVRDMQNSEGTPARDMQSSAVTPLTPLSANLALGNSDISAYMDRIVNMLEMSGRMLEIFPPGEGGPSTSLQSALPLRVVETRDERVVTQLTGGSDQLLSIGDTGRKIGDQMACGIVFTVAMVEMLGGERLLQGAAWLLAGADLQNAV